MEPAQQLDEIISRMTPDQFARLVAYAESLLDNTADTAPVAAEEEALLQRIRQALSVAAGQRLRELTRKSEAELLTTEERAEYISLAEEREQAEADRLEAVIHLARLRGISPARLLTELGLGVAGNG